MRVCFNSYPGQYSRLGKCGHNIMELCDGDVEGLQGFPEDKL